MLNVAITRNYIVSLGFYCSLKIFILLQVALGDLILSEESSIGNVSYSVSPDILPMIHSMQSSDREGEALWKLPGLLPRAPHYTASQVLLWISKLIMEVKLVR